MYTASKVYNKPRSARSTHFTHMFERLQFAHCTHDMVCIYRPVNTRVYSEFYVRDNNVNNDRVVVFAQPLLYILSTARALQYNIYWVHVNLSLFSSSFLLRRSSILHLTLSVFLFSPSYALNIRPPPTSSCGLPYIHFHTHTHTHRDNMNNTRFILYNLYVLYIHNTYIRISYPYVRIVIILATLC